MCVRESPSIVLETAASQMWREERERFRLTMLAIHRIDRYFNELFSNASSKTCSYVRRKSKNFAAMFPTCLYIRWKTFLPCSKNIPFNFLSQHGVKPSRGRFKLQWHLLAPSQLWQLLQLLLCNNDNGCKCDQYIVFNKSICKRNRKCMRWNSSINKTFQLIFHFTIFTYFSGRMKLVNP